MRSIKQLINERYHEAKAVFWGGSVSQKIGTKHSDLDLVIIFENRPHAYREAFFYDNWPIDAFIHDLQTLKYFCKEIEAVDGRPALINMILNGQEVLNQDNIGNKAKDIARSAFNEGPNVWNKEIIDKERFLITDIFQDIQFSKNIDEQRISAVHLFEPLLQFYFRAQNKWAASGKSLMRLLQQNNPELALELNNSFDVLFKTGQATELELVITRILQPYGGFLWNGFKSNAPIHWKL